LLMVLYNQEAGIKELDSKPHFVQKSGFCIYFS